MNVPLELRRGCKRVLVLDHDVEVRDALVDLLMTEGYEVAVGGDAEIGLALVKLFRPDAIILDPRIPGPRTDEFVRRLRSQRENARVRVIVRGEQGS